MKLFTKPSQLCPELRTQSEAAVTRECQLRHVPLAGHAKPNHHPKLAMSHISHHSSVSPFHPGLHYLASCFENTGQGEEKGHSSQRQGHQHGHGSSSSLTNSSIFLTLLEHVRWRASRIGYSIGLLSLSRSHIPVFHPTCRKPQTLALPSREYLV